VLAPPPRWRSIRLASSRSSQSKTVNAHPSSRPGLRVDRQQFHKAVTDGTQTIELNGAASSRAAWPDGRLLRQEAVGRIPPLDAGRAMHGRQKGFIFICVLLRTPRGRDFIGSLLDASKRLEQRLLMGSGRLVDTAWRRYFAFDWNQLAFLQLGLQRGRLSVRRCEGKNDFQACLDRLAANRTSFARRAIRRNSYQSDCGRQPSRHADAVRSASPSRLSLHRPSWI
jgi:hypothetical protein